MTLHRLLLDCFLDTIAFNSVICLDHQAIPLFQNLNASNGGFNNPFRGTLVFLVDINNIKIAFLICGIEHTIFRIPSNPGVAALIGVCQRNLLGFKVGSFKPF